MSYIHLTPFERSRLETPSKLGFSTRHIARQLHRHHSTIARELKRHSLQTYCAELAQSSYHHRRLHVGARGKKETVPITTIQDLLTSTWSPEQIANTVLKGMLSFKTIYRWLYDGTLLQGNLTSLRQKENVVNHRKQEDVSVLVLRFTNILKPLHNGSYLVIGNGIPWFLQGEKVKVALLPLWSVKADFIGWW